MKERVLALASQMGHETIDLGTCSTDPVDYPDSARAIASAIQAGRAERGILLCGSGVGACMAANKFRGIRAGTCHDTFSAHQAVEDDDANVLCLGARIVGPEVIGELVHAYLKASFSGAERHVRRLQKVAAIESGD
jgi:RpiB/LacA/LacB family sugar-phosphate isomerase